MTEPCCERDHDRDGNCDRHPEPRKVGSTVRVKGAARRVDKPAATAEELRALGKQWKAQGRPVFPAERSIYGRNVEITFDGHRLGAVTAFASERELTAIKRKQRRGTDAGLTVPGVGAFEFEKVNSAWELFVQNQADLSGFTMRVTLHDNGMPNPEVTDYTGVTLLALTDGVSIQDIVTTNVRFSFQDSVVIEPVIEPIEPEGDFYNVFEVTHSTGELIRPPAVV